MSAASPALSKPTRAQINALFEQRPSSAPSLQTPKPTQPHHDPRYQYLLNSQSQPVSPRPYSPSSSISSGSGVGSSSSSASRNSNSTNPSPNSTIYSASTLSLREEEVRKAFGPAEASSSRATYEPWMLNPEVASYAHVFPPIDIEEEEVVDDDGTPMQRTSDRALGKAKESWDEQGEMSLLHGLGIPRPQPVSSYRHLKKPWTKFFDAGSLTRDRDESAGYAQDIVRSQVWDDESLSDLAQAFVWRTSDPSTASGVLASFASRIREELYSTASEERWDARFELMLGRRVIGNFISCWHADKANPAIIYDIKNVDRSPRYLRYVSAALRLSSFIGELYVEKFLDRAATIGCVRILLFNLSIVEHLYAIDNILRHAGTRLWKEAANCVEGAENLDREMREFVMEIWRAGEVVQDHRSFLAGRRCGEEVQGVVRRKVVSIVRYVEECRSFVREGWFSQPTCFGPSAYP